MTEAVVADPAANTSPPPAPSGAADALNSPPPAPAFYESFQNAETKTWAQERGFKSGEEIADLARKFDGFKDADPASLALKPKADDPNAFVAFAQEHLGAPKEASAYGLDKLEGVDADLAGAAGSWFAEAGLTPFQAQHIAAKQMAHEKARIEREVAEDKVLAEREMTQLKVEFGSEYDAKLELGRRAMKAAAQQSGVDPSAFINYIESGAGTGGAIKMMAFFGQFIKEGDYVEGGANEGKPPPLQERLYKDI